MKLKHIIILTVAILCPLVRAGVPEPTLANSADVALAEANAAADATAKADAAQAAAEATAAADATAKADAAQAASARAIEIKTTNFTAVVGGRYILESAGTITVTNPTGTTRGQSFECWIGSGSAIIAGSTYSATRFSIRTRYSGAVWANPSPIISDPLQVGLHTWSGSTFTGAQSFSSTTRPTSSGSGDPAATSLMTRADTATESLWGMLSCRDYPVTTYATTGTGATAAQHINGWRTASGTAAASAAQANHSPFVTGGSAALNSSYPVTASHVGNYYAFDTSATGIQAIRFVLGGPGTTTFADQNPLTGRGFGWEIYFDTAAASHKIRAFAHNGTTFKYGTAANFATGSGVLSHIIVQHVGNGTINVYASTVDNGGSGPARPSTTPICTCTGAPTSGNFGSSTYIAAVAHSTTAGSVAGAQAFTVASRIKIN